MNCSKCGNKIKEQEKFCGKCGNPVTLSPKTVPDNALLGTADSIVAKANRSTLMGHNLSVTIMSVVSIIVGFLYLAPYYYVSYLGETLKLNWFSSINHTNNADENAIFYWLAGGVVIVVLLLLGNAIFSFLKNKISCLAKPALISSIIAAVIILLLLRLAVSEVDEAYGRLAEMKITVVPYAILVLSIATLVGVIRNRSFEKKTNKLKEKK